jgi:uncharacterized membrane-anchored protein
LGLAQEGRECRTRVQIIDDNGVTVGVLEEPGRGEIDQAGGKWTRLRDEGLSVEEHRILRERNERRDLQVYPAQQDGKQTWLGRFDVGRAAFKVAISE